MDERWIVIPGWDEFQHRDAGRGERLIWLRDYARQLDQDEYRGLTFHQRGLLRDIRHSYATTHGQLSDNTLALTRRFGQRVLTRDLEALSDAGFLVFSASKPPALSQQPASLEEKRRDKNPQPPYRKPVENRLGPVGVHQSTHAPDTGEGATRVAKMIMLGVLTDQVDLEAEIRGFNIQGQAAQELRNLLTSRINGA